MLLAWLLGFTVLLSLSAPSKASADTTGDADVAFLVRTHDTALAGLSSPQAAAGFFEKTLRPALSLTLPQADQVRVHGRSASRARPSTPPKEFLEAGMALTTELAAWRLAHRVKNAANARDTKELADILERSRDQRAWLLENSQRSVLAEAFRTADASLLFHDAIEGTDGPEPIGYAEYKGHLDRTVPRLVGPPPSWAAIGRASGADGVREQLLIPLSGTDVNDGNDQARMTAAAMRYFHRQVQPVLLAETVALATIAEVEAERHVMEGWVALKQWPDRLREAKGAERLCGTWNWTIHNHQNHLDHKTVMVFPPPGAQLTAGIRPTKMLVLGDVVYLRWEMQGAVQEDSLLFTGEGQRLEGSFVNSTGAWGSITGKRVGPCPR